MQGVHCRAMVDAGVSLQGSGRCRGVHCRAMVDGGCSLQGNGRWRVFIAGQ